MDNLFQEEKYKAASQKALGFIKSQLNVNNYTLFPSFAEDYADSFKGRLIGHVEMPEDAAINYPNYIYCDQFYDESYVGQCTGRHQNTAPATKHLGVEITTHTDQAYRACVCALHNDGTWRSERYYKETDYYGSGDVITRTVSFWYRKDVVINSSGSNGLKGFTLKYYEWQDEDGSAVDVDALPGRTTTTYNVALPNGETEHFLRAKTYTLSPKLTDDTIIDDALPRYADYSASHYIVADVEYLVETTNILYDRTVEQSDLPESPPELTEEPEPFIRDAIVQPGKANGEVIITWITNFTEDCALTVDGETQTVPCESVVSGYFTYHGTASISDEYSHSYTITGKDVAVTKAFATPQNNVFIIAGDPQLIGEDSAEIWYQVQNILDPLPALIIGMGDQVDAITDSLTRTEQYHMFTAEHSVPIATVRGNHDRNAHFLGHYGLPNSDGGNFYFTFNDVLFIALDTNVIDAESNIDFIKTALAAAEYRWAVLLTHHSLYSTSTAALTTGVTTLRKGLTDYIVNESGIDLVIAGHEHFLCRTTYPGKLFFTAPTCTGSKYGDPNNQSAEWNEVTVEQRRPMYTVMEVSDDELTLTTYDLKGTVVDSCSVGR